VANRRAGSPASRKPAQSSPISPGSVTNRRNITRSSSTTGRNLMSTFVAPFACWTVLDLSLEAPKMSLISAGLVVQYPSCTTRDSERTD
jgi:hypothetical protein